MQTLVCSRYSDIKVQSQSSPLGHNTHFCCVGKGVPFLLEMKMQKEEPRGRSGPRMTTSNSPSLILNCFPCFCYNCSNFYPKTTPLDYLHYKSNAICSTVIAIMLVITFIWSLVREQCPLNDEKNNTRLQNVFFFLKVALSFLRSDNTNADDWKNKVLVKFS